MSLVVKLKNWLNNKLESSAKGRLTRRLLKPVRWVLRSSTLRLTLMLSGLFAIGMAAAIFIALSFGRDALIERVDTTLSDLAKTIDIDEAQTDTSSLLIRPLSAVENLPKEFKRAANRNGGTIELDRKFRRFEFWRVMVTNDARGTPILIALPLDDSAEALDVLSEILWTTAALVLFIALIIGLLVGVFAQRRLAQINRMLGRLATGDLQARSGIESTSDDLDDLARQLDTTAAELERFVSQTRNLSASIAHDLRTPLARLRAQLEMLPHGEERGAALEEAGRLSQIFDTIMRVARIESAQGTDGFAMTDLGELAIELEDIFGPVVEDSGKHLVLHSANPATVLADRQMLIQAIANLIQNAIVHGGDEILLFTQGKDIGVADNGNGVDPEQYDEILKPMVRLDRARETDGSGLGLALVRAVADRHQATLTLSQNMPQGLRVSLKFTKM